MKKMVTKEDLKDWLSESLRDEYEEKLEAVIDSHIKRNALAGKTTFYISTGRVGTGRSEETPFYDTWYTKDLSETNRNVVHKIIIKKYKDFGFNVQKANVDCGWNNSYFALRFADIDDLL